MQLSNRKTVINSEKKPSNPAVSAWVSANAGAGKTYLLVSRLKRLLLAGVAPSRILCLTYTRAAAAEMTARIMDELSEWVWWPDEKLDAELAKLTECEPDDALRARARMLFAMLADDAEGLRMVTLHSFCQSLLGRFPLEAKVEPHFSLIDGREQGILLKDAVRQLIAHPDAVEEEGVEAAVHALAAELSENSFQELSALITSHGRRYRRFFSHYSVQHGRKLIYSRCGVDEAETALSVIGDYADAAFEARKPYLKRIVAEARANGSPTTKTGVDIVERWLQAKSDEERLLLLNEYALFFYTQKGEVRSKWLQGKVNLSSGEESALQEEFTALSQCREKMLALKAAETSANLLTVAYGMLRLYERLKQRRAMMDYDDMIARAAQLLSDSGAAWVMYKLDEGIDHVLVDEAQDTSREQWEIVKALTEEFFSGEGAREAERSLFVVGDEKQSIFRFQGAFPEGFAEWRNYFETKVKDAGREWVPATLPENRRSVAPVLNLVDAVFALPEVKIGDAEYVVEHAVHRQGIAGCVELWPLVEPEKQEEKKGRWTVPMEREREEERWHVLAAQIAGTVKGWLDKGELLESQNRPIRPGDIMILVQRREPFMPVMIRALQEQGVAVAGVDRLVLSKSLVAKDLLAAAAFALLPEDDLNLAALLKSPICHLSEESLMELAMNRADGQTLWRELERRKGDAPEYAHAVGVLRGLMERADAMPVYEFFAELLDGEANARARILGRMGGAQQEVIEEFLNAVLTFEQDNEPTLQAFCQWMKQDESEIKREKEQAANEVRIMTVHGSKGLEAPIVFLPDTVHQKKIGNNTQDRVLWKELGKATEAGAVALPLKCPSAADSIAVSRELSEHEKLQIEQEDKRLLYVAMTRARDRLYVCGAKGKNKAPDACWHTLISQAIESMPGAQECDTPSGRGWRLACTQEAKFEKDEEGAKMAVSRAHPPAPPSSLSCSVNPEIGEQVLSPSRLFADEEMTAASPQEDGKLFSRGTLIHKLLQYLPDIDASEREDFAHLLLSSEQGMSDAEKESMITETLKLLADARFAALFAEGSQAEVPVCGKVVLEGKEVTVAGQMDRLAVGASEVWVVDYKTHATPPRYEDIPRAYIRQLDAYGALLASIYPDKRIRRALLWTAGPQLMELEEAGKESALGT